MTVSIKIDPESGTAIASCSGILQLNDAKKSATALWKTPGRSGRSVVWDFRKAQFDMSTSDIEKIANFILTHQPETPPSKVAFVAPGDLEFGLARVFDVYREDSRTTFRVFREYEKAISLANSLAPDIT